MRPSLASSWGCYLILTVYQSLLGLNADGPEMATSNSLIPCCCFDLLCTKSYPRFDIVAGGPSWKGVHLLGGLLVPGLHSLRIPRWLPTILWCNPGGDLDKLEELDKGPSKTCV